MGLRTAFWNFLQGCVNIKCEKCEYGSLTFVNLLTLARPSTFRLQVLPVIDGKPGSRRTATPWRNPTMRTAGMGIFR